MDNIKCIIFTLIILAGTSSTFAQNKPSSISRYWHRLIHDTSDVSKPQFLIYPFISYSPETKWMFGIRGLQVFYAKRDTTNRLSEINAFIFYTLEKQYGLWFNHTLYSNKNNWFFIGRMKFQKFPFLYFGIGPTVPSESLALVSGNQILVNERVQRKVFRNFYLDIEVDFSRLSSVNYHPTSSDPFELPIGSNGSTNIGLGGGFSYDNRHNVLNVRKGFFSKQALIKYDGFWGSDYSFYTLISDNRIYRPVNKSDVLAAQLFGQFSTGTVPFNHLALIGGENLMRGYYTGQYRDENLIAGQVEYRFLPLPFSFTKRIGFAMFVSTGTVFNSPENFSLSNFVVSGGGGLRYLLFPKKDIFARIDIAFTKERPGLYIFVGEAF